MSQSFSTIAGDDIGSVALKTKVNDSLEALRTDFSGTTEPSSPTAYQRWADTTTGLLKRRNAANTGWDIIGLLSDESSRIYLSVNLGSLTTTGSKLIAAPRGPALIEAVNLLSAQTTAHDASNKVVFQLRNLTQAEDLFSATVGTFDTDGGIGGGAIAADTSYELLPDQNDTIAPDDVLRFAWTVTGSPTNVSDVQLQLAFAQR